MRRQIATVIAALLFVAGCGGGSDGVVQAAHTTDQLLAALPMTRDVPGGVNSSRCPGDPEHCSTPDPPGDTEVSARIVLKPLSVAATWLARQAQEAVDVDAAYLRADVADDADQARARWTRLRDGDTGVYDGDYSVEKGVLTERGSGAVGAFEVTGWQGFLTDRTIFRPDDASRTPAIRIGEVHLVRGRTVVDVHVFLAAGDRSPDAATSLADRLARDYVERLG